MFSLKGKLRDITDKEIQQIKQICMKEYHQDDDRYPLGKTLIKF